MPETLDVRVQDHSGTIVLRRPDQCNSLTRNGLAELRQAFEDLHQEKRVRAVILTGAGNHFCAGMDLKEIKEAQSTDNPESNWFADADGLRQVFEAMLRFPKPIIAAVNGAALGAGAGLVLASDIVIAAKNSSFGFPDSHRGLASGISTPLLAFRLGAGVAANLLLRGQPIEADEAYRLGIFHEIVAFDLIWAHAHEVAGQCARASHESLAMTKRMLNETVGDHLITMLTAGAAVSATSRTTEAAVEGIQAFLEKREPNWP